jgi:hypothetical protein
VYVLRFHELCVAIMVVAGITLMSAGVILYGMYARTGLL